MVVFVFMLEAVRIKLHKIVKIIIFTITVNILMVVVGLEHVKFDLHGLVSMASEMINYLDGLVMQEYENNRKKKSDLSCFFYFLCCFFSTFMCFDFVFFYSLFVCIQLSVNFLVLFSFFMCAFFKFVFVSLIFAEWYYVKTWRQESVHMETRKKQMQKKCKDNENHRKNRNDRNDKNGVLHFNECVLIVVDTPYKYISQK